MYVHYLYTDILYTCLDTYINVQARMFPRDNLVAICFLPRILNSYQIFAYTYVNTYIDNNNL